MTTAERFDPTDSPVAVDRVRLLTLVRLRWVAIAGQLVALIVTWFALDLRFEGGAASLAIVLSVVANLFFSFLYPRTKRLSEAEATLMLTFDILQLGLLLYLCGGLNNPFSLLLIVPATIAATMLGLRASAGLALLSLLVMAVLFAVSQPLQTANGAEVLLPPLFHAGFAVAIATGTLFLAIYARQVTTEINTMGEALLATQLAFSRAQKLSDIGGIVAAAAHELGTPLATIKLVSAEMEDLLADQPDLAEDARLISEQADRCRDILRSMGKAGREDEHLRLAPFEAVVAEAAEPHLDRGKDIRLTVAPGQAAPSRQPMVMRRPELVHGLRNLIQNAVDFAETSVWVEISWDAATLSVRITDDGPGFPSAVIGRIGDPFVRQRAADDHVRRPGYDGMGLGLFIAKSLLERTGATLRFANGSSGGAVVLLRWPGGAIDATTGAPGKT